MLYRVFIFAVGDKSPLSSLLHNHKRSAGLQADDTRRKATTRPHPTLAAATCDLFNTALGSGSGFAWRPLLPFPFPSLWYSACHEDRHLVHAVSGSEVREGRWGGVDRVTFRAMESPS